MADDLGPNLHQFLPDRNRLAHNAVIVPKQDCFKYIDAIEAELLAWGFLPVSAPQ